MTGETAAAGTGTTYPLPIAEGKRMQATSKAKARPKAKAKPLANKKTGETVKYPLEATVARMCTLGAFSPFFPRLRLSYVAGPHRLAVVLTQVRAINARRQRSPGCPAPPNHGPASNSVAYTSQKVYGRLHTPGATVHPTSRPTSVMCEPPDTTSAASVSIQRLSPRFLQA